MLNGSNKTRIVKLEQARIARARRYCFYYDEVAEAEAQGLPYALAAPGFEQPGMDGAVRRAVCSCSRNRNVASAVKIALRALTQGFEQPGMDRAVWRAAPRQSR